MLFCAFVAVSLCDLACFVGLLNFLLVASVFQGGAHIWTPSSWVSTLLTKALRLSQLAPSIPALCHAGRRLELFCKQNCTLTGSLAVAGLRVIKLFWG